MEISKIIKGTIQELDLTFKEIFNWFDLTETERNYQPQNGGWTINEILEHISRTNKFLLILIQKGKRKSLKNTQQRNLEKELTDYKLSFPKLDEIGKHKSFHWIRPKHMKPTGEIDLNSVKTLLKNQLEECHEVLHVLKNGEGVLFRTTMTVNKIGKLDVYQYINFLAKHGQRHIDQMKRNLEEFQIENQAYK